MDDNAGDNNLFDGPQLWYCDSCPTVLAAYRSIEVDAPVNKDSFCTSIVRRWKWGFKDEDRKLLVGGNFGL